MSKRKRTLLLIVVLELLLAGAWLYFHNLAVSSESATADSARVTGQMFGGAMGVLLGLAPLLYLIARRNDMKDEAPKE